MVCVCARTCQEQLRGQARLPQSGIASSFLVIGWLDPARIINARVLI
jgi:hypothetical protein